MWVDCGDETNVVIYAAEGESSTVYNKPNEIKCNDKNTVQINRVGFILVMMKNQGRTTFNLYAEAKKSPLGIIIGVVVGVLVVGGIIGFLCWKKRRDAKLSHALMSH